ncbi:hypothetical protein [Paenibacillus sp. FSL R7-0337]|uniref:hypothetical protein n=1 Tax=Paenibacillus sp. FSL R7-0337 TaxID=1926588 RepID=UPI00096D48D3|nr:hypothetical protein [Paenibacillus sp. FSL R7-0337]OMF96909.1 hypothetical protein BK147_12185 [Paenibacillus sp. FSL R7-0337]
MKLNEHGVLIIEEDDIHDMYFFLVHDGLTFKDSFQIGLERHKIELYPGSVSAIVPPQAMPEDYGYPEEDLPRIVEGIYSAVREYDPGFGVW